MKFDSIQMKRTLKKGMEGVGCEPRIERVLDGSLSEHSHEGHVHTCCFTFLS